MLENAYHKLVNYYLISDNRPAILWRSKTKYIKVSVENQLSLDQL